MPKNSQIFHRQQEFACASTVFHNVRHQAEISFNQKISGFQISLGRALQQPAFLLLGQWFRETAGLQLQ